VVCATDPDPKQSSVHMPMAAGQILQFFFINVLLLFSAFSLVTMPGAISFGCSLGTPIGISSRSRASASEAFRSSAWQFNEASRFAERDFAELLGFHFPE
jgi:hypothetical protein